MNRVMEYANMQARVRGRLGELPGAAWWRELAEAPRLGDLVERLRESNLGYCVGDLPRNPDPLVIESHLASRWHARQCNIARLLPDRDRTLRRLLERGAELALQQIAPAGAGDSPQVRRVPEGDHPRDLNGAHAQWARWREDWQTYLDGIHGWQEALVRRLERLWRLHEEAIVERRRVPRYGPADPDEQWFMRARLERGLRDLVAGDSFHPAMVPILLGLEWIQFERCRALLLARAYGWPVPGFFPH